MTLPNERTIAVLVAREFLVRVSSAYVEQGFKGIKRDIRDEAARILRHFPEAVDLYSAGKESPEVFDHETAWRWMK